MTCWMKLLLLLLVCYSSAGLCEKDYLHDVYIPQDLAPELPQLLDFNATLIANDKIQAAVVPPMPKFIQFETHDQEYWAKTGWWEMVAFAQAAVKAICSRTPSFYRYFNNDEAEDVKKAMEAIFANGMGPPEASQVDRPLVIIWGNQPSAGSPIDQCASSYDLSAYMVQDRPDAPGLPGGPAIVLCPRIFDAFHVGLKDMKCSQIPNFADEAMNTIGSLLLHEMTHWRLLTKIHGMSKEVDDYGFGEYGRPAPDIQGWPQEGYGPKNCQYLNKNRAPPHKMAVQNADSYVYFALEAYWVQNCNGKSFVDVPLKPGDMNPEALPWTPGQPLPPTLFPGQQDFQVPQGGVFPNGAAKPAP